MKKHLLSNSTKIQLRVVGPVYLLLAMCLVILSQLYYYNVSNVFHKGYQSAAMIGSDLSADLLGSASVKTSNQINIFDVEYEKCTHGHAEKLFKKMSGLISPIWTEAIAPENFLQSHTDYDKYIIYQKMIDRWNSILLNHPHVGIVALTDINGYTPFMSFDEDILTGAFDIESRFDKHVVKAMHGSGKRFFPSLAAVFNEKWYGRIKIGGAWCAFAPVVINGKRWGTYSVFYDSTAVSEYNLWNSLMLYVVSLLVCFLLSWLLGKAVRRL